MNNAYYAIHNPIQLRDNKMIAIVIASMKTKQGTEQRMNFSAVALSTDVLKSRFRSRMIKYLFIYASKHNDNRAGQNNG